MEQGILARCFGVFELKIFEFRFDSPIGTDEITY